MRKIESQEFGAILVRQVPVPDGVIPMPGSIYTYSGRVAVPYRLEGEEEDHVRIATVNDDGSDWLEIFDGECRMKPEGNGFRFMPFPDNTRALIGDYVFECQPDMDYADKAKSRMVPIHYPDEIKAMPNLWKVWSEIVISPDNEHMAWNGLGSAAGAYVGKLRRTETEYVLDDVKTISGGETLPDPDHPGCVIPAPTRGGEIKQFIRGGLSISFVGADRGAGDSMVQDLDSQRVYSVTKTPGYDETTIFSPDNRLGVVMSTRFSPKTNNAVLGMIPRRGNMATKGNIINQVYMYGVSGVRMGREGNIGPALIDIEKSQNQPGYLGVDLSDPTGEWAYYSPMSWHPSGKKLMWNEGQKKTIGNAMRITVAELTGYTPGPTIPAAPLPENIPYAMEGVDPRGGMLGAAPHTKIAGKHSGYAETTVEYGSPIKAKTVYENFSDDGKSFLNGWESVVSPGMTAPGDTVYDAKMELTGEHTGEMDVHLTYRLPEGSYMTELLPDSRGFASYDGERADIADMLG